MNKKTFSIVLGCSVLLILSSLTVITPPVYGQQSESGGSGRDEHYFVRAKVLAVKDPLEKETHAGVPGLENNQLVSVKITSGKHLGQTLTAPHAMVDHPGYNISLKPGDEVILYIEPNGEGIGKAYVADYARDKILLYMALAFMLSLAIFGGLKGIKSIISLAITGLAIVFVLLPLMFKGYNPILTTVVVAAAVTTVTMIIIGGLSTKTISAVIGTRRCFSCRGISFYSWDCCPVDRLQ